MSFVGQLSLQKKLTWLAMTCTIVALGVAAISLAGYEWRFYRRTMFVHLQTLTNVTARDSTAAVAFANGDDGARILSALEDEPAIKAAILFDEQGRQFAEFRRSGEDFDRSLFAHPPPDGLSVSGLELRVTVPVKESKRFGTLVVLADISGIRTQLGAYSFVLSSTLLFAGLVASLLTGWLKQRIVAPIHALAAAALQVQKNADYTIRVPKEADDEVGALTEAFNAMLARIHQNEAEIARGADRLRLAVEAARIGTWDWDVERDVVI